MLWLLTVFKYNNPLCGSQPGSTRLYQIAWLYRIAWLDWITWLYQIAWLYSRLYLPDFYEYTDIPVRMKLPNTTFSTRPIMKQLTTVYFPRLLFS